jgi:hypothetical protein
VPPTTEEGGVSKTELQLTRELLEAKLTTVEAKIDGVEKWVKWGALAIATNAALFIASQFTEKAPDPTSAIGYVTHLIGAGG